MTYEFTIGEKKFKGVKWTLSNTEALKELLGDKLIYIELFSNVIDSRKKLALQIEVSEAYHPNLYFMDFILEVGDHMIKDSDGVITQYDCRKNIGGDCEMVFWIKKQETKKIRKREEKMNKETSNKCRPRVAASVYMQWTGENLEEFMKTFPAYFSFNKNGRLIVHGGELGDSSLLLLPGVILVYSPEGRFHYFNSWEDFENKYEVIKEN